MALPKSQQLGRCVRCLRGRRHRSQRWLANEVGVHINTIVRWEREGISPEHPALRRIGIALDCLAELLAALRRARKRARRAQRSARPS
jgi:DNA-binding XRE family transcriptional regulator